MSGGYPVSQVSDGAPCRLCSAMWHHRSGRSHRLGRGVRAGGAAFRSGRSGCRHALVSTGSTLASFRPRISFFRAPFPDLVGPTSIKLTRPSNSGFHRVGSCVQMPCPFSPHLPRSCRRPALGMRRPVVHHSSGLHLVCPLVNICVCVYARPSPGGSPGSEGGVKAPVLLRPMSVVCTGGNDHLMADCLVHVVLHCVIFCRVCVCGGGGGGGKGSVVKPSKKNFFSKSFFFY